MKQLDFNTKHNCQYAIPLWLRDQQIEIATKKVKGRIQPYYAKREEAVAVVGFGPSLNETWQTIKDFQYVITCSGAHKFLIERGIMPTWHCEVDPRSHKIELLGPPHKDVEYLIASTCHPDYFDHLNGFNIKLWHVFDATEDGRRLLPPGEWALSGGCDVGLRAMTIAAFLGFRDLHIFGLDGCAKGEERHAAFHPNGKQKYAEVEFNGVTYLTTPAMLEAAKQTLHELKQMPAVRAKFYGEGLTQAMMKDYVPAKEEPKNGLANCIGFSKPELISSEYIELNRKLHQENMAYGVGGEKHAPTVLRLSESLKTKNILDYGSGKGRLAHTLPFAIAEYDPAVPGKEESPKPADIVVCTDVLEHVEPSKIDFVLADLQRCVRKVGYLVIHTQAASKTYANGENTHLLQREPDWWENKLKAFFKVPDKAIIYKQPLMHVVVAPK